MKKQIGLKINDYEITVFTHSVELLGWDDFFNDLRRIINSYGFIDIPLCMEAIKRIEINLDVAMILIRYKNDLELAMFEKRQLISYQIKKANHRAEWKQENTYEVDMIGEDYNSLNQDMKKMKALKQSQKNALHKEDHLLIEAFDAFYGRLPKFNQEDDVNLLKQMIIILHHFDISIGEASYNSSPIFADFPVLIGYGLVRLKEALPVRTYELNRNLKEQIMSIGNSLQLSIANFPEMNYQTIANYLHQRNLNPNLPANEIIDVSLQAIKMGRRSA